MATVSSYDPVLKQIYRPDLVEFLTYKMRPLLGALPKYEKFGGRDMPVPVIYGNPQMVSAAFATAQATSLDSSMVDFVVTRVTKWSLAHVSSEVAAATMSDKHAFIGALKKEVDCAMNALADTLESDMFQDGTGFLGAIASLSTVTLTLSDINDVTNFEVNMELVFSEGTSGAHGDALIGSGNSATVTGINRTLGTLTSDSAWATQVSTLAADDFIYRKGDAANGSSNVCIEGLDSWCPDTSGGAPAALFGVTRSTDSRLYGTYHDGSSQAIEEAFIDGQSKAGREGGKPNKIFCNNGQYRKLSKELGSKKEYSETAAAGAKGLLASIAYRGIKVHGDYSDIDVVPANKCPSTKAWALQTDTWTLATLGPACRFDDTDGNRILRRASSAGVEARLVSWGNLACKAPVYNTHIKLASV